jgi:hypothetical protein
MPEIVKRELYQEGRSRLTSLLLAFLPISNRHIAVSRENWTILEWTGDSEAERILPTFPIRRRNKISSS